MIQPGISRWPAQQQAHGFAGEASALPAWMQGEPNLGMRRLRGADTEADIADQLVLIALGIRHLNPFTGTAEGRIRHSCDESRAIALPVSSEPDWTAPPWPVPPFAFPGRMRTARDHHLPCCSRSALIRMPLGSATTSRSHFRRGR